VLWGVGPTFVFPTASDDALGQGKCQVGPAAVGLYLGKQWIFGERRRQALSLRQAASRVHLELDYSVVKPDDFRQRWLGRFQLIPVLSALIKEPLIE
jgi:hypothetical protein